MMQLFQRQFGARARPRTVATLSPRLEGVPERSEESHHANFLSGGASDLAQASRPESPGSRIGPPPGSDPVGGPEGRRPAESPSWSDVPRSTKQ